MAAQRHTTIGRLRPTVPASSALGVRHSATESRDPAGPCNRWTFCTSTHRRGNTGLLPLTGTPGPGVGASPRARGHDGLIPDRDLRSDWCRRGRCEAALRWAYWTWPMPGTCCSATTTRACCSATVSRMRCVGPETLTPSGCSPEGIDGIAVAPMGLGRQYRGDAVRERVYYVRKP